MPALNRVPLTARPMYVRQLRAELFNGARMALVQLIPAIAAKSLDASELQVAAIAVAGGCGMLVALFMGSVMRGRRLLPFVLVPGVLCNLALIAAGLAPNVETFVFFAGAEAFFMPLLIPAITGIQRVNYPVSHRAWLLSNIRTWFTVVGIVVAWLSGKILNSDPDTAFRILLPLGGVLGLFGMFMLRNLKVRGETRLDAQAIPTAEERRRSVVRVLRDKRFLFYQLNFWLFGFANLMLLPLVPVYLKKNDVPYDDIANILVALPGLMMILTLPFWGRLLDRSNPISMRTLTTAIWSFQPLLLLLGPWLADRLGVPLVVTVYAAYVFFGLASGGSGLIWGLGAMYFSSKDDLPVYMGMHTALTGLRRILAPLVGAWIVSTWAYQQAFLLAWCLQVSAVLTMIVLMWQEKRCGRLVSFAEYERAIDEQRPDAERELV